MLLRFGREDMGDLLLSTGSCSWVWKEHGYDDEAESAPYHITKIFPGMLAALQVFLSSSGIVPVWTV